MRGTKYNPEKYRNRSVQNVGRLSASSARSYERYGVEQKESPDRVGRVQASVGDRMERGTPHTYGGEKPISESRGLRGKIVKNAKGGRQFKPEPMQKRPARMPTEYKSGFQTKAEIREELAVLTKGWARKIDGTWVKVQ